MQRKIHEEILLTNAAVSSSNKVNIVSHERDDMHNINNNNKLIQKLSSNNHDESHRRTQKEEHALALKKIEEKLKVLSMEIQQQQQQQNPAQIKTNLISSTSSSLATTTTASAFNLGSVGVTTTTITTTAPPLPLPPPPPPQPKPQPQPSAPIIEQEITKTTSKAEIASKISCVTGMVMGSHQNDSNINPHSLAASCNIISNALPPLAQSSNLISNNGGNNNNNKKKFFLLHKQNQSKCQSQHLNLKKISNTKVGKMPTNNLVKKNFLPKLLTKNNNVSNKHYVNRSTSISDNDNKMMKLSISKCLVFCLFIYLRKKNLSLSLYFKNFL